MRFYLTTPAQDSRTLTTRQVAETQISLKIGKLASHFGSKCIFPRLYRNVIKNIENMPTNHFSRHFEHSFDVAKTFKARRKGNFENDWIF